MTRRSMSKMSNGRTTLEYRKECVQRERLYEPHENVRRRVPKNMIEICVVNSKIEKIECGSRLNKLNSTDKTMTDWYRCGSKKHKLKLTWTMTNQYRCSPKNWNLKPARWMTDQYRCGPKTQTQTDKTMIDWYRCDSKKTQLKLTKKMNDWSI